MATVCENVVTVTTPGDCVDVLVTDYGIAVNPKRPDLIECLDKAGIRAVFEQAIWNKPAWHGDLDALHRSQAGRNMNEIGG